MKRILLLSLVLIFPSVALSDTMVWRVSDGKTAVYIGGTVHVLRKSDYPLPKAFEHAYQQADTVVFETDLDAIDTLPVQQLMLQRMTYPDGRKLRDVLRPETYQALQQHCAEIGLPIENFQAYKPAMIVVTLLFAELRRLGIGEHGVDKNFHIRAKQDGKALGSLEEIDQHLDFVANMGMGEEDQFIRYSLRDLDRIGDMMDSLLSAWRTGDLDTLQTLLNKDFKRDFPKLHQSLLVERNNHWIPQIKAMYQQQGTEYVLVGAAHLLGEEGLIRQLQRAGYQLDRL